MASIRAKREYPQDSGETSFPNRTRSAGLRFGAPGFYSPEWRVSAQSTNTRRIPAKRPFQIAPAPLGCDLVRRGFYSPEWRVSAQSANTRRIPAKRPFQIAPAPLGCGLVFLFPEFGPAAFCGRPHLFLDKSPI
jgi:hypothetical protein